MTHRRSFLLTCLAGLALLALAPAAPAQQAAPVRLRVKLPQDATLEIDGTVTKQTGSERVFESPPVAPGKTYTYTLVATWKRLGEPIVRRETVKVTPGKEVEIDLRDPPRLDVPFVPTPQEVVDKMLDLANVKAGDVVYDLGCGDGRIVITAAKRGATGVGIDLNPVRIRESKENAKKAGVEDKVQFREGNVLRDIDDIDRATVVTLYLLPDVNLKLRPMLQKRLKPGTRIVSHDFDMGDWKPLKTVELTAAGHEQTVYLWEIGGDNKQPVAEKTPEKAPAKEPPKEQPKARAEAKEKPDEPKEPDVIFVPTPQAVVDKMLEMAGVKAGDVVYDLGCGDGRIVVSAAKKGATATGFDVDPERIKESRANVKKGKVEDRAKIEQKDIFTLDLSKANVITLYLLPELNVKLIPQLEKLKPGSRIVSHDFDMRGVKPKQVVHIKAMDDDGAEREHTIYLWEAPLQKEKE